MMKKTVLKSKDEEPDSDADGVFDELFPSDMSDDGDDEDRFLLKEEREVKKKSVSKDQDESIKKSTKKARTEETQKKLKTKNTKAPTVETATEEEDEIADGEDIADEVIDFDMSEEESEASGEEGDDEDD